MKPGGEARGHAHVRRRSSRAAFLAAAFGIACAGAGALLIAEYVIERTRVVPPPPPEPLEVEVLELRPVERPVRVEAVGYLEPRFEVRVAAEVAGRLTSKPVEEGERVEAGELVAEVDPEGYRRRLEAARAHVEAVKARLGYVRAEAERARRLRERNSVAASELERWVAEERSLEASLAEAEALRAQAELDLERSFVRAPRSGVWYRDLAREGEYVHPGAPVGVLRVLDPLDLRVEVAGDVRLVLKEGQAVEVEILDAREDLKPGAPRRLASTVRLLPQGSDAASRRFPVVISVPNPAGALVPGLLARAVFELERRPVLLIPKECVFDHFGRKAVYAARADGRGGFEAALRHVSVRGLRDLPASWLVLEGLDPGERVILGPLVELEPGRAVRFGVVKVSGGAGS